MTFKRVHHQILPWAIWIQLISVHIIHNDLSLHFCASFLQVTRLARTSLSYAIQFIISGAFFTIECSADIMARQQTDGCAILAADSTTTCSHPAATAVRCRGLGTTPYCWLQYYTAGISHLLWWNYYVDERLSWRWRQCISLICWYHTLSSVLSYTRSLICCGNLRLKKKRFVLYNLGITYEFQMSSF